MLPFSKSKGKSRFRMSQENGIVPFRKDQGQDQMRLRKLLILFTAVLACLTQASNSVAQDSKNPDSKNQASDEPPAVFKRADFNKEIYYKHKLEFSLETGWHPINIPWVYDFAVGDSYTETPLKYTLVPVFASLRWQTGDIAGRWIFRGNWDLSFTGSVTFIPRGPETRYFVFIFGVRRNFVYRNWKIAPYFDQRGGIGEINAKEPLGVLFSQGQDLTFTYNMGAGVRYNVSPRYSIQAGMNYMHISNGYLSQPAFTNYGINVYGPMFGFEVRLGKPHHETSK
jgi:hypothetical protein